MDCTLKLLGTWASSYTHRVQLALKLKHLDFDYAEEDLADKSALLLHLNPVYKKVPVLVHGGKAIAESVVILEYVDEVWPQERIMAEDAFERAVVRFWCHFADDKLGPAVGAVFRSSGEEQKEAVQLVHNTLGLIETELREGFFKGRKFFGGDKIGLLDIVLGCGSYWLAVFDEVANVKLVDPEAFPLFSTWLVEFEALPEVKEIIPPADKLMEYALGLRNMMLMLNANTKPNINAGGEANGEVKNKDVGVEGSDGSLTSVSVGNEK